MGQATKMPGSAMTAALLPRAIVAFVALPGTVAFLVPLLIAPASSRFSTGRGVIPLGAGVALLIWCVREFYVAGRGTLAPWSPPVHLVTSGPYRVSRNPMYVAVLLILTGWALGFWSRPLAIYAVSAAVLFHLRILLHEEPFLMRTHGSDWELYQARVPRWFGRI